MRTTDLSIHQKILDGKKLETAKTTKWE